jgi:alpha-tubulin suppressor-like RCC1 family protein
MRVSPFFLAVFLPVMSCGDDDAASIATGPVDAGAPDVVADTFVAPADAPYDGPLLPFRGPTTFSSLHSHTCSLEDAGSVRCWGWNDTLQSGVGSGDEVLTPTAVQALTDAIEVSAGGQTSCALRATKQVVCWGSNAFGQLGQADAEAPAASSRPLDVPGLVNVRAVAVGDTFACAVKDDKTVVCWGRNDQGQLGSAVGPKSDEPVPVPGVSDVEVLAAGPNQACVVKADKTVMCWGRARAPAAEPDIENAVSVAAGLSHACALLADRTVACWGPAAIAAPGINDAIAIRAGYSHTCVLREGGRVQCWGKNEEGALGNGKDDLDGGTPTDVVGITDGIDISAGLTFGCVRRANATAACWGSNDVGQLGSGTDAGRSTIPVNILGY